MKGSISNIDTSVLDDIIVGRVEPFIYAFSTETVPNYLKVGDTFRGVRVRLNEWGKVFPDLIKRYEHSAQIDDETIFRDFSVHTFLVRERGKIRLQKNTFTNLPYYSTEFFKDTTAEDVNDAVMDIIQSAHEMDDKYTLYSTARLPKTIIPQRTEDFRPRENQQQAIENFKKAVAAGRTKLLLYAVMRFGKSFTSMCCAKEIGARFVVIVSAKGDVQREWQWTIQSHIDFADYCYLDSESLKRNETVIADTLEDSDKKVALFLTLQDLQGNNIKEKHKEVFEHQIDLLIIDETHYGARGESYGKVLREQRFGKADIDKELKRLDGFETLDQVENAVKILDRKITLHLSGTPYRILMGDEFKKEDIIAFVQFTDIIDAQRRWNEEHLKDDCHEEWENPYYGFPQMIRFAFNPNESSRRIMEQMHKEGITYAFSELFRPFSMTAKSDSSHSRFKHEPEILDLLEVIDGTKEDENLLGFLDLDIIKKGKMCRHIVCALPFRASCDAMAALIHKNKDRFKNLCDYEIINIAGFDDERKYKSVDDVKRIIKEHESNNRKTMTLTVNRMLTGSTVPQWDTMLFLKGTASPQEYDQAIFRLQNQYITTYKDKDGNVFKYNMKPQTLLVDFDPNRMFRLQELKSQFYNVNTEVKGNKRLKERIAKELEISPIIVMNIDKLQQVTPTNITDAVREYSRSRSILNDASDIPVDGSLLNDADILTVIREIAPIDAKNGFMFNPSKGKGHGIDAPGRQNDDTKNDTEPKVSAHDPIQPSDRTEDEEPENLKKRLAAYYARILFFSFLTESTVKSLDDVIEQISLNDDNIRIAKHLGLSPSFLKLIHNKINPSVLNNIDYKIENTNGLIRDDALPPIKRVEVALRKFGRISDSEIVTPAKIADEMVSILPYDELSVKEDPKYLDIASKQGEFTISLYKKFGDKVKNSIYAIPTSALTYEFTRKTYKLLGMPVENIFADFTSFDLISKNNENIINKLKEMRFDVILGNPPYQETLDSKRSLAKQLFPIYIEKGVKLAPNYFSLITPARWFTADAQDNSFPKLREFVRSNNNFSILVTHNGKNLFPNTELSMVDYFLWKKNYSGDVIFIENIGDTSNRLTRPLFEDGLDIIIPQNSIISIIKKIKIQNYTPLNKITTGRDAFGIVGKNFKERSKSDKFPDSVAVLCAYEKIRFIPRSEVKKGLDYLDSFNVFTSKGNGGAGLLTDGKPVSILGKAFIGTPGMACTDSLIPFGKFPTRQEAENLQKYMRTKFLRLCVGILKVSQNLYQNVYAYVPMQDFTEGSDIDWSKSVEEIDSQLYAKYNLSDEEIAFIESMIKPM